MNSYVFNPVQQSWIAVFASEIWTRIWSLKMLSMTWIKLRWAHIDRQNFFRIELEILMQNQITSISWMAPIILNMVFDPPFLLGNYNMKPKYLPLSLQPRIVHVT